MKLMRYFTFIILLIFFVAVPLAQAATYEIDPIHSSFIFKVKHLIGYDTGAFVNFWGMIETNGDNSQITAVIAKLDVNSLDTRSVEKDKILLSPKVLDSANFPEASFVGKRIENQKLIGDLTVKGKTKEVALDFRYWGTAKDKEGRTRIGLSARGMFNRKDFDMGYNEKLDRGEMAWGNDVQLLLEIEGLLKE